MNIEIHELLKLALEAVRTGTDPDRVEVSDVVLLSEDSDTLQVIYTLHCFAELGMQGGLDLLPESLFDALAAGVMNTLDMQLHFDMTGGIKTWSPVASFGAKLLVQYTRQHGENVALAYQLSEALRLFSSECHPERLFVAIGEFHRSAFDQFSIEILRDIADKNQALQSDMGSNDLGLYTCTLSDSTDNLAYNWDALHTTPFLSNLVRSAMNVSSADSPEHYRSPSSELRMGLQRICARLLKIEGHGLKIECTHIDYLLVGQLIDRFSKLHAVVDDESKRDQYRRASDVLVDVFVVGTDSPLDNRRNVYNEQAGGLTIISSSSMERLIREFADLFEGWPADTAFSGAMTRLRRAVLGSVLVLAHLNPGYFVSRSERDIHRMLVKSKTDLMDQSFHQFIKHDGQTALAERISSLNDAALKKVFLRECKAVRGHVLESDLGF